MPNAKIFRLPDLRKKRDPDDWSGPPVRTLADMSEAEILELERTYGCPVKRPAKKRETP